MNIDDWNKLICHNNLSNKEICDKFIEFYINWIFRCVKESKNKKSILKLTESTLKHRHKIHKLIYELSVQNRSNALPLVKGGICQR